MDKKTTSILDGALSKSERTLRELGAHPKRTEFEAQIRDLRAAIAHYSSHPPSISDALTTARQVLDLREAVQRAAVYQDLERLYSRDRAKALALFAARAFPAHSVN